VAVVDTTAAGDAFVGGYVAGLLQGLSLAEAVRYATCAGSLATTVFGAQTSLPTAAQVQAFYREA
jgi:ribokinase